MGVFFYNIFLFLFNLVTRLIAPFNDKAGKWVRGRKNIFSRLEKQVDGQGPVIWMHCASLGEFEQGRPVLERIRSLHTGHKILLTFFSPSGYEVRKDYAGADWVFYLPMDSAGNARRFLDIVRPTLVIFVKYEFWYYYLKKIKYREIPLILISAQFRKTMSFFKWYGAIQRKILSRFDHLFVQDKHSKELLDGIGLASICSVSGDTRFDRVIEIAENFRPIPVIERFLEQQPAIVAGSTWPEDEIVLQKAFEGLKPTRLKLIIAPHEIDEKHLDDIKKLFPSSIRFSEAAANNQGKNADVMVIDNIGMLANLYNYAYLAYVGGGLSSNGVHNVLEAAVYKKIVLFGPNYEKYAEAVGLSISGGGLPFTDEKKDGLLLQQLIEALLRDKQEYDYRSEAAGNFVSQHRGATNRIISFIQENRLLTR